ncbi:MAG: stage II sporulation protein R [Syntrophomonadaceae bacterium]|nr:stage II sporulation protein R [Syntrophomonadaceae bacterium]
MMKKILGIIFIITITFLGTHAIANQNVPLENSVLRLHVLANSDASYDQALKMAVKDQVVKYMQEEFSHINNFDEAALTAQERLPDIERVATEVVKEHGYDYPVQEALGKFEFPTKSYGNLIFPQGEYEAVRIIIGEGEGQNWWCVLFPPLCMVSSSDKGISMESPREAKVTWKCLELLPKGVKFGKHEE